MSGGAAMTGLREALAALLPDATTTLLLRACVQERAVAECCWRDWLRGAGEPRAHLSASDRLGRLLPLLQANLARHGIAIGHDLEPYLRTALVHERLRFEIYERAFTEVMGALACAGVETTLLKGAALTRTVFDPPYLRHCHDLDLLVQAARLAAAREALGGLGCRIEPASHGSLRATHRSGLEVMLHRSLLASRVYALDEEAMLERQVLVDHAAGGLRVLAPEAALAHVVAHAATVDRAPAPQWAVDAYRLATSRPGLDWERVRDLWCRNGLALAVQPLLHYLRHGLGGPVPDRLDAELHAHAARDRRGECRRAVRGILLARRGLLRATLSRGGLRTRWAVLRHLFFPPDRDAVQLVSSAARKWGRLPNPLWGDTYANYRK